MMDMWTTMRFVVLYPAMAVFGLVWAGAFWLRWRRMCLCPWNRWASLLGVGVACWALSGIAGLWISKSTGFGLLTSAVFAVGAAIPALVLVISTIEVFVQELRNAPDNDDNQGV